VGSQRIAREVVARVLLDGPAAGNAVVVKRLLAEEHDVEVPLRTLQRTLAPHRSARRAAEVAAIKTA
jgi:hypothetical protein